MKGTRAHLKKESLMQSDRLETVDDTDAGVREAAEVAGVEEGWWIDGVRADSAVFVEGAGAALLFEAAGVSNRAPPRLFVADMEADAALGGATAPWWAAAMASEDACDDWGG
jgi:hypothetical protein